MMVYHQASRDTAHKVAGILSGHAPASKPPAPGLLDEDFLLESTSLGISENNAEVYGEHNLAYQEYPPKTAILSHAPSRSVCPWDMKK